MSNVINIGTTANDHTGDSLRAAGEKINNKFAQIDATLVNPKKYKALLNQEGSNAPVATVLNSTDADYLGNIVWTRQSDGFFKGTLSNAFTAGKTVPQYAILLSDVLGNQHIKLAQASTSQFWLNTYTTAGVATNGLLVNQYIEIQVYA